MRDFLDDNGKTESIKVTTIIMRTTNNQQQLYQTVKKDAIETTILLLKNIRTQKHTYFVTCTVVHRL